MELYSNLFNNNEIIQIKEKKKEYKEIKAELKKKKSDEKLQKKYMRAKEQLEKLKTQRTDKVILYKIFWN